MSGWLARFFCGVFSPHRKMEWVRNIYGDEINLHSGKRSVWVCGFCGAVEYRAALENEG
jgi:hypothetical protein